jgi:hypothetical protein
MVYGLLLFEPGKSRFVLRFMQPVARRWNGQARIAKVQPSQASLASETT